MGMNWDIFFQLVIILVCGLSFLTVPEVRENIAGFLPAIGDLGNEAIQKMAEMPTVRES